MLPKINRIRKRKDFEKIFKNSKSVKNKLLIFRIIKNNLRLNRFGFIVSQKVSKKATIRNKIRRRLSESIKLEKDIIKNGTDLVIIALPGIENEKFLGIKNAIHDNLIKAELIARLKA